jgi:hypothetical protein
MNYLKYLFAAMATAAMTLTFSAPAMAEAKYEGIKGCGGCHKSQKESWLKTSHAHALESLKPKAKVDEKKKAKLDPAKDYSQDKDCVGCHTIGSGADGGFKPGLSGTEAANVTGVGCENCHGAGGNYRKEHRKAADAFKKTQKATPRQKIASAGQNFNYDQACAKCHMNYEGSPWKDAKAPYTPFTPKVDAKYGFDFDKAVHNKKALHEHFKLKGVFEGEPVPAIRAEFQKTAKEPVAATEDKE